MKAFFTVEAVFALLLLPFLFYFVASQSGSAPQEKLLLSQKMDFLHDVLDSLDRGGQLNEAGVLNATIELNYVYPLCYKTDDTNTCAKSELCVWRTYLDGSDFRRVYLCTEAG